MSSVRVSMGDFDVGSIAATLEPYLPQIAKAIQTHASARKTVVFCPLISIAQELADLIPGAREVNGTSPDRKETLEWFDKAGPGAVLCNAMLLTEGWDCPSCDCVVVLRPTKVRSLYCQMIGRGTRLFPGKSNLLILDFLWLSYKHNLCKPASLITENDKDIETVAKASTGEEEEIDLLEAVSDAESARRNALAEAIEKMPGRSRNSLTLSSCLPSSTTSASQTTNRLSNGKKLYRLRNRSRRFRSLGSTQTEFQKDTRAQSSRSSSDGQKAEWHRSNRSSA